jgi:threonine/homoserine/homoserine lactone efflux protein
MISGGQLLGFTLASLVLIVIPGPGVLFVVGRALAHGRRTALATACGHAAGLVTCRGRCWCWPWFPS